MSEVADVERNPRVQTSTLKGKNKDENEEISDNTDQFEMVIIKARKWIGILVYREVDGNRNMGEVVNYCGETKLYKIVYENDVSEEVDCEELRKIIAPPPIVSEYFERVYPSWFIENEEKKKRHMSDRRVPIHPRRHSAYQQPEPKKRRSKKPAGSGSASASSYVPLAFRETRKDAYYYY